MSSRLFNFLYRLFKLLGVATVAIDSNSNEFVVSKSGIAYNAFLMILVLGGSYFAIDLAYFTDFAGRGELEKITDTIQTIFVIFTCLFVLSVQCVRQRDIAGIANELRRSIAVSSTLCSGKTHREKSLDAADEIKRIIIFNALLAFVWLITTPSFSTPVLLFFVSMTLCNFVINAFVMQYSVVLTVVAHLFDALNASLAEITSCQGELALEINFIQKYALQTKLGKLSQCRSFFTALSRLSRRISEFMETTTLACMTNVFLTLIIYGYYVMKPLIVGSNVVATSISVRASAQMCFSIVGIVLLTRASSRAVNQSKRTGEMVNECLYKEGCSCHPDVEKQLNLFSNYLLHTNVHFGVCNLFALDESLLMSIAGSITTYLVILLQFKQTDEEQSLPAANSGRAIF